MSGDRDLQNEFLKGRISRRQFIVKSLALGASLSGVSSFLASCGPAPTEEAAKPAATAVAVQPTATAVPPTPTAVPIEVQKLVIAGAKDIIGLDPVQQNDADSNYVYDLIIDTVAMLDAEFNVTPHLAESWDISEDGLTYTYHFRKGVKFHDGTELTADDVIFTIDRILENKYPEGRKKEKIEMIDSYKKVDDYTVEITLQFPYAPFEAAFGIQYITPKAAVERLGDEGYTKAPIGCGPFKFVEWRPNDYVLLEGFDDYWMVEPKLDEITVRPIPENAVAVANLLAGDVDIITDVVGTNLKQLKDAADRGIEILNEPGFSYFFAGFRMLESPFTDVRFRKAVYMATDFDAAIAAIFPPELGVRAYGTVPPGLWPQDEDYLKSIALKQDQEQAKALFQELIDEGVMDKDYQVTVAPPPDDARISVAEVMVTNLQELGVNAEILKVDWGTYTDLLQGDQNLIYMLGTVPAIPDPDANVRWLFSEGSSHGRYLNLPAFEQYPDWDAQIKQAEQSRDRAERERIYRDLVRTMMELVIHIPLYVKNTIMAEHDYVKDWTLDKRFRWNIVRPWANVYIEGKGA